MQAKQNRFAWIGAMALGVAVLLCAGLLASVGLVRGEESPAAQAGTVTEYTVSYANGVYGDGQTAVPAGLTLGTSTLSVDGSGCITLPATFSEVVTANTLAEAQKLDVETFYFDTYNADNVKNGTLWAYTFTGWQIKDTENKIAGETVLQPGFVIPPEVLESYASDGSLELVALWGKCYFIQNPYETMAYEAITRYFSYKNSNGTYEFRANVITAVNTNTSTGATGAYDYKDGAANTGNDPDAPIATVPYLYTLLANTGDPYDACATAVVLTGDLDYIQDRDASATYNKEYAANAGTVVIDGVEVSASTVTTPGALADNYTDTEGYLYHQGQNRPFGSRTNSSGKAVAGVTFKSLQETDGEVFSFYYKPYNDECQFYSSVRFDNVRVDVRTDTDENGKAVKTFQGESLGWICRLYNSERANVESAEDGTHYFETTVRMECGELAKKDSNYFPFSLLRSHDCENVVLCSGRFYYLIMSWGDTETEMERHWYAGGNAWVNQMYPGRVSDEDTDEVAGDVYITVTGGTVGTLYGGNNSGGNTAGDRIYRIYGSETRTPVVNELYGGTNYGVLTGNVDMLIRYATVNSRVCGGGRNYSATVLGNASMRLENTTVNGDVYGGGLYGCCEDDPATEEKEGQVTLTLSSNCTVTGTVFGSGRGNSSKVTSSVQSSGSTAPADWDTAPSGFPVLNADGSVTSAIYKRLSFATGGDGKASSINWNTYTDKYALTASSVEAVQIIISDSQVVDVYGGGDMGNVIGNTQISILGSTTVSGSVYGGGNGDGAIDTVTLYTPIDQVQYDAPYPIIDGTAADINTDGRYQALKVQDSSGSWVEKSGANLKEVMGATSATYSWSNDASQFEGTPGTEDFVGINTEKKLIYYSVEAMGQVGGDTSVIISDTATVSGNVYGGGNAGQVLGNATVEITGGTMAGDVYGGGNQGAVKSKALVAITGGSFGGAVYGGGNQGAVSTCEVKITDADYTGRRVYGGGNAGPVTGAALVTVENVSFPNVINDTDAYIYGGGNKASVGSVELTLKNVQIIRPSTDWSTLNDVIDGAVFGGGNAGQVLGDIAVSIDKCQIDASIFGGGNASAAKVGGNITVTATDLINFTGHSDTADKAEYSFYGGGRNADVAGNITISITDGMFDWFYGGGYAGNVGNVTVHTKSTGTKTFSDNNVSGNQPYISWCTRIGGNKGNAKAVALYVDGGYYRRNVHIGGNDGVCDSTYAELGGGAVFHGLWGGSDQGAVLGTCHLVIKDITSKSNIYGGGDQPSSRVGQTHVVVEKLTQSSGYSVYGGSDQGWVVTGTSTTAMVKTNSDWLESQSATDLTFTGNGSTLVEFKGGTGNSVYGGSNGADASLTGETEKFGNIAGSTSVIISGGTVTTAYGGNNAGGTIGGGTGLTVSGGSVTTAYGGNNAGGTISGGTDLTVSGGSVTTAYGGNKAGGTVVGSSNATVSGGTVTTVYGGSNAGGTISGGTVLSIQGGTVSYGYGGCNASGTVYGTLTTRFTGGTVSQALFGGGNAARIASGTADGVELYISDDAYAYGKGVWVFGGGNLADCEVPVSVEMSGGQVYYLAGGGNAAACLSTQVLLSGGSLSSLWGGGDESSSSITGDTHVTITGGTVYGMVRGGGNLGSVSGNTYVDLAGGSVAEYINGGGNKGVVEGSSFVNISDGSVVDVYGGGDSDQDEPAVVKGDTFVTVSGGTVTGNICGGGNRAWSTVEGNSNVAITGGSVTTVYGGGNAGPVNGDSAVTVSLKASVSGNVYGGGNAGAVGGASCVIMDGGTVAESLFGGGQSASVANASVQLSGGTVTGAAYGGGQEGAVSGRASVTVDGGFVTAVYGGGQEGPVGTTHVQILDDASVSGNVYGGGEGVNATVKGSTTVFVNMNFDFQVTENPVTTTHITPSGMVYSTVLIPTSTEFGYIGGNIYGGGDLARVGDGTISAGGDKATISILGKTSVTVENGQIVGSVFGGGRGIPENDDYNFYMGVVFGSTHVTVNGGLIGCGQTGGSVYGGGEQSRVYTVNGNGQACTVSILETDGHKIGINGSVFGGGDRGESATTNASVPTVYGNVDVLIQGIEEDGKPSAIYFLAGMDGEGTGGGVYGDGNLCLVEGTRTITLRHFEPAEAGDVVKTFYSLQRADEAILYNSAVVLLGAPDLVEEGDTGLYSINRIGQLSLQAGSVVKLDQVVKYLGGISSDVHDDRRFIHDGTNGRTGTYDAWTKCTCRELNTEEHTCGCLEPLTQELIDTYRSETGEHNGDDKNVVCVANGLYLEILDETGTYGPVTGLFTLQLLYANPGEGGGFVYGSISNSTGDFICETLGWKFVTSTTEVTAENFETLMNTGDGLFIRVAGKAFQRPTEFSGNQTYYTRVSTENSYMEIIDDVGGALANDAGYTYYYWYIGGPSVTYQVEITGYIGAAATEFASSTSLPQHDSQRSYVLYSVSVNNTLANAVANTYELVQTASVSGQQIAIELRLGNESLGFLAKNGDEWAIVQDGSVISGYNGVAAEALANRLYTGTVGTFNDQMTWVLHKASTVSATAAELEVYLDIDLYEYSEPNGVPTLENVTTGTAMLSYTVNMEIVRMTASQAMYHDNLRSYTGVATYSTIHITGNSCFTAEFQTRYVPAAYPGVQGNMVWALTTQSVTYYMCPDDGAYFSVDANGALFNFSEGLSQGDLTDLGNGTYKHTDTRIFSVAGSFSAQPIPKNTKITLVDLSGAVPAYYYYICNEAKSYIPLTDFMQMGSNTAIDDLAVKPEFMTAYADQAMALQTERLLFVFDFEQAQKADGEFQSGVVLAHVYGGVDIMDYSKQDANGKYNRSFPKAVEYKFCQGETGVNGQSYTALFQDDAYQDMESAVLRVHVEEDDDWINTLFREYGFALKIQLVDEEGEPVSMPAGMYFEYKGQYYYPGPDSTFIAVPVHEFGDHEIILHNPRFSLRDVAGDRAYFSVSYYSAPDERYFNAFDTGVERSASYALEAAASGCSLQVLVGQDQILAAGEALGFTCLTQSADADVTVTAWRKTETGYVAVALDSLFENGDQTLAENEAVDCQWQLRDGVQAGTYRLVFTCENRTEYLNLIVK